MTTTTPTTEDFKAAMARVEEFLPVPDVRGRRFVTADQITRTKDLINELFEPFYAGLFEKLTVELDGKEHHLGEEELNAMPVGTLIRCGDRLFVRRSSLWLNLLTGWDHKNGHLYCLLTNADQEIVMTTPR